MTRRLVPFIKALIAAALLVLVVVQVWLLPVMAADTVRSAPEFAALRIPVLVAAITLVAAAEIVLVCLWPLLSRVARQRIFERAALRWVDGMIGAAGLATVACLTIAGIATGVSAGPYTLWSLVAAAAGLGVCLVIVVLRALLVEATADRTELQSVI
jgi:hypothetical protein